MNIASLFNTPSSITQVANTPRYYERSVAISRFGSANHSKPGSLQVPVQSATTNSVKNKLNIIA